MVRGGEAVIWALIIGGVALACIAAFMAGSAAFNTKSCETEFLETLEELKSGLAHQGDLIDAAMETEHDDE